MHYENELPEIENFLSLHNDLPPLAPSLIDGVLRQGHKMLLSGPSKAGKSYALIELCIAIADGSTWFGFGCRQGRVLYVNLELDRASCLHRFKDVCEAKGAHRSNLCNIDIWNLRGNAIPMDRLAPELIRRSVDQDYIAVVIDPIYKIITGDENSAEQMARFCNQFDKICDELDCAVIYCHHHSKGVQVTKKAMDRASGSGVFARDPDAILDLIELELPENVCARMINNEICALCEKWLGRYVPYYEEKVPEDGMLNYRDALTHCRALLDNTLYSSLLRDVADVRKKAEARSGWRLEGTLREFPKLEPVDLWFDYPLHKVDRSGALKDAAVYTEEPAWKKAMNSRKPKEVKSKERKDAIEQAYNYCNVNEKVTIADLADHMGTSEKSVRNKLKEHGGFKVENNAVFMI